MHQLLKCQKWGAKHTVCPPNFKVGGRFSYVPGLSIGSDRELSKNGRLDRDVSAVDVHITPLRLLANTAQ